ncbi:MAG: sensor domain-containing diguanylate cyclase [Rhodocyclaceae bacterium]|nr:MAG: sensor domain-containing diguanylate cyclase [Rhodocyclaceae bacterium]
MPPSPTASRHPHWIVRAHWVMRSISFVNAFAFFSLHLAGRGYGAWVWLLLTLQFLVYPHLIYRRACHAENSQRAELQNLVLDCFLVAIWVSATGFPLWITFTLLISTAINNAISQGYRGIFLAFRAFGLGALLGIGIGGFQFVPEDNPWITGLCVFGLSWYLLGIGRIAHTRALLLRAVRENLKQREQELRQANESLQQQLAENLALQRNLHEQANRDALTGLFNRRYLIDTFERELARCSRQGQPLCLMLIDVDHFKQVNDGHGHQIGDLVLQELGRLLAREARQQDVACRFGGEEFVMLLPGLPESAAHERAEQWRQGFSDLGQARDDLPGPLSLSIGVALFPAHGADPETLLRVADQALYKAKTGGRNRVVIHAPTESATAMPAPQPVAG